MLLFDLSHTSHSQARTGVQRVTLELRRALKNITSVEDITHDPYRRHWRPLQSWETRTLETVPGTAKRRGAYWPLRKQLRAWIDRNLHTSSTSVSLPKNTSGFLTTEIFTARTGQNLPDLFERLTGPKVAMFHDAISLRMPHLAPKGTVGRFPNYLSELRKFDGIVAVSEDSRQSLIDYWKWAGWNPVPDVIVSSHGLDHLPKRGGAGQSRSNEQSARPKILCVGSIEGRKNHLTLLSAAERLWRNGDTFELRIIGTLQRDTGHDALTKIRALQAAGRPVRYDGWVSDQELQQAYESASFTVYPSLLEGFGLPVWESVLNGVPCICSNIGATYEVASGGGCVAVDTSETEALTGAITTLLHDGERLKTLREETTPRVPPTWHDSATRIHDWMSTLSVRNDAHD